MLKFERLKNFKDQYSRENRSHYFLEEHALRMILRLTDQA